MSVWISLLLTPCICPSLRLLEEADCSNSQIWSTWAQCPGIRDSPAPNWAGSLSLIALTSSSTLIYHNWGAPEQGSYPNCSSGDAQWPTVQTVVVLGSFHVCLCNCVNAIKAFLQHCIVWTLPWMNKGKGVTKSVLCSHGKVTCKHYICLQSKVFSFVFLQALEGFFSHWLLKV